MSMELFKILVDNSVVGIYLVQDYRFRYVNSAFCRIWGYSFNELVGRLGPVDITHPDYKDIVRENFEMKLRGEIDFSHFEFLGVRKDGSHVWCEVFGRRTSYMGDTAVVGVLIDITSKKSAEERLKRELLVNSSVSRLSRALLEGFSSLEDMAKRVLESALSLTGAKAGFVSAISVKDEDEVRLAFGGPDASGCELPKDGKHLRFSKDRHGKFRGIWGHALNKREPFFTNDPPSHEAFRGVPQGHIPIKNFLSVPVVAGGELLGQIALANKEGGFSEDDLEAVGELALLYGLSVKRDREIEALQESERRYKVLTESSLTGVFIESDGRIVFVNERFPKMLGYMPDDMLGKSLLEFVHPEHRDLFSYTVSGMLLGRGIPAELEIKALKRGGGEGWYRILLARISHGGRPAVMGNVVDITDRKELERKLNHNLDKMKRNLEGTIKAFASTVEKKDPYTAGHQRKVAELSREIAKGLGLFSDEVEGIYFAGLVHDIGKIAVPSEILTKPGKLTEIEFELLKTHPQVGYDILKDIEFPWPIAEMVLQHHERLDGSGYPQGLKDGEIILGARIIGVADVVEAMSSHRPYRPALGIDKALSEIRSGRGRLYDSDVVDMCIKLFMECGFAFSNA